jgi:outer membrane beta-barrel protein
MRKLLTGMLCILFFTINLLSAPQDLQEKFGPRPIDGTYVESLQTYLNPKNHHLGFSLGIWPIQPYYNGFSLDFNYVYYFNKGIAWEVVNYSNLYTIQTGLTAELAEKAGEQPKFIQKPTYILSSNIRATLAYGKFIWWNEGIRYFRSYLVLGPALIATNLNSKTGVCVGWGMETFVNESISWRFDIRDSIASGMDHPNNMAFLLGTNYGF